VLLLFVLILLLVLFGVGSVAISPLLWILVVIVAAVIIYNLVRR